MNEINLQREVLQKHIDLIIKACYELQPEVKSIILCGSYGRDEGSWLKDDRNDWIPYNDYDVCIVAEKKVPEIELKVLEKLLAKKININWIDLYQLTPYELKHLKPSIKNYDLKNASKVIYGDLTILDTIPEINSSTLPLKEIQTLYFTRLYTLIGSLDINGIEQDVKGESSRFFRNQMAKAVLAVVDVLLLIKGAYNASYCKRVESVTELYPEKKEFIKLSQWALAEKLNPKSFIMNVGEVFKLYSLVHFYFLNEMHHGLTLYFKKHVNDSNDIAFCMKWLPHNLIKRIFWIIKFFDFRMEKKISILLSQSYLANAWSKSGVDFKFLKKAILLLRAVDNKVPIKINWNEARLVAARLRMRI